MPRCDSCGSRMVRWVYPTAEARSERVFFVRRIPAGGGPGLHAHPYEETFVIHEGSATFVVGAETVEAEPEMIIVVPPATPHRFIAGPDGLRSVNIHGSDRMIQENLPDDG